MNNTNTNTTINMIKSPLTVHIPPTDVASFVFASGTPESRAALQYFDAAAPSSKCYSLAEAKVFTKQIAKGLQDRAGLEPDDKVLLFSGNCLFFPVLLWGVLAGGVVFTAAAPVASVSGTLTVFYLLYIYVCVRVGVCFR
jgi:acyl-CoA synthetase (AMP-forming)/AMP-acid ligase II